MFGELECNPDYWISKECLKTQVIKNETEMRSLSVKTIRKMVGLKTVGTEWVLYHKSDSKSSIQTWIFYYITLQTYLITGH